MAACRVQFKVFDHQLACPVGPGIDENPLVGGQGFGLAGIGERQHESAGLDPAATVGSLDQAFEQDAAGAILEAVGRVGADAAGHQFAAIPVALDQRGLAFDHADKLHAVDLRLLAGSVDRAQGSGMLEVRAGLNAGRHQGTVGARQAADLDRLAQCQALAADPGVGADLDGLPHDVDGLAAVAHSGDRTFEHVQDGDVPGLQTLRRIAGFDGDHLPDGELVGRRGVAVFIDRRTAVEMHFDAIDANRGKSADDTDDADRRVDDRHAGAANTAGSIGGWRTSAADAAATIGARCACPADATLT